MHIYIYICIHIYVHIYIVLSMHLSERHRRTRGNAVVLPESMPDACYVREKFGYLIYLSIHI